MNNFIALFITHTEAVSLHDLHCSNKQMRAVIIAPFSNDLRLHWIERALNNTMETDVFFEVYGNIWSGINVPKFQDQFARDMEQTLSIQV